MFFTFQNLSSFFLSDFAFGYFEHKTFRAKAQCFLLAVYFAVLMGRKKKDRNKKSLCEEKSLSKHPGKTSHVHFMFVKLDVTGVIAELL